MGRDGVVDLSERAGLDLRLDLATGELTLGADVVSGPPGVRRLAEMRPLLADPDAAGPDPLYRLYRGVHRPEDAAALRDTGLRYDLTVTLPGSLGGEYAKTAGHYHGRPPDGTGYPEVYEVLHGRAAVVLQWVADPEAELPEIRAVWVAVCGAGARIVIPPDCGHVTVNLGAEPLVVGDLVAAACPNSYGSFRRLRGAACYLLADSAAADGFRLEANPRYGAVPAPQLWMRSPGAPLISDAVPLYTSFLAESDTLAFLVEPEDYVGLMFRPWGADGRR